MIGTLSSHYTRVILHLNNNYYTVVCPDGSNPVDCFINPCLLASCPAVGGATCVAATVEVTTLDGFSLVWRSLANIKVSYGYKLKLGVIFQQTITINPIRINHNSD